VTRNSNARSLVDFYLRLSVDRDGKDSLERQEADLREWARRSELTVRRVWVDSGKSGYKTTTKRSEFDAAVRALRDGEVGTLAAWKLDRLSRRGAGQIGTLLDDIERVGGRLVFLQDSIDTSAGDNRTLVVLVSEQARAESRNTSVRVSSAKQKARRNGQYLGGAIPFGYAIGPDRRLRQEPSEAPLAREVADRVLAGETLLAICRDWNARGVPTRRGGSAWRPSTLSAMLRSPVLAGLVPERRRDPETGAWSASSAPWRDPESGHVGAL
jgi:site-specific DNA recombinase